MFLTAVIIEEWAHKYEEIAAMKATETGEHIYALIANNRLANELAETMGTWLQKDPPTSYHEMSMQLSRIHGECSALLQSFAQDCKVPQPLIPVLSPHIDIDGLSLEASISRSPRGSLDQSSRSSSNHWADQRRKK